MLTDSINARCVQPLPQRDVNAPPPPSTLKSHTAASDAQASTQKRKYKLFKVDAVLMRSCVMCVRVCRATYVRPKIAP